MSRPLRLVLMSLANDDAARQVRDAHMSFEAIPGVTCALAVSRAHVHDGGPPYTHLSLFEFADTASRTAYHRHPVHTAARESVRAHARNVVVIDVD